MSGFQITAIGFSFLIILLVGIEVLRIKKFITPFSVTSIPFMLIIILSNFVLIFLDFPPVTMRAQLFILCQLLILWIVGYLFSHCIKLDNSKINKNYILNFKEFREFTPWFVIISWFTIIIVLYKVLSLFMSKGGWVYFGDPQYEKEMAIGFAAHILQVSKVCFLYLIFIKQGSKYKKIVLITLIGLFFTISIVQVKFHILWTVLMTFYFYNAYKPWKIQIKNMVFASIVLLILFNLFWVSLTLSWGSFGFAREDMWLYFARQTANYFATGPILLDQWLNNPNIKPDWTLIIILKNFYNTIIGSPVRHDFVPLVCMGFLKVANHVYSNIGTGYGTFFLIGGWKLTIAYSILSSSIFYLVYFLSYKNNNYFLTFLNLLFLCISTLTFFGQYYTAIALYEMPVIFLILGIIFKIINYIKYKILLIVPRQSDNY